MQNVIERIINLLIYLIESSSPVTAEDVRNTVHGYGNQSDTAFHRMFERDKDVLRRLGVPLERVALDVWEVDFGYTVDQESYAIPDPRLTQEEKVALSVAAKMVRLGGGPSGLDALLKLGGVERGVGLEPLGADLGSGAEILGELFGAITERRIIDFNYRGHSRTLKPYGMAHRRGHWYLVGDIEDGSRVYRIDRIDDLAVGETPDSFKKPRGFNVKSVMSTQPWEAGSDPVVEAVVRFDADVAWWAARTLGVDSGDGDLVTPIPVANRDAFVGWILSFGPSAEVLEPEEIRDEVLGRVEAALENVS